jgi:acyl-[acyl-carrier-protein]-phospholipid O-acyltransferase/long-chain-fatty-acid--[acyl-carrier-protein] ligase
VLRCKKTGIPVIPPARDRGIAEIMVPRDVMVVDQLPLLGTGKTDYPRGADTG